MRLRSAAPALVLGLFLVSVTAGCKAPAPPSPVLATEMFSGSLALQGKSFHTFAVKYVFSTTDLSVTINSLSPLSGITIGIAFGTVAADSTCTVAISNAAAPIGQELFASGGVNAGTYCVQIFDAGTLTETVNYSLTVKHY